MRAPRKKVRSGVKYLGINIADIYNQQKQNQIFPPMHSSLHFLDTEE